MGEREGGREGGRGGGDRETEMEKCVLYALRLQGEKKVYDLIKRVQAYLEPRFKEVRPDILCSIYIRRIEHLYYKVYTPIYPEP